MAYIVVMPAVHKKKISGESSTYVSNTEISVRVAGYFAKPPLPVSCLIRAQ